MHYFERIFLGQVNWKFDREVFYFHLATYVTVTMECHRCWFETQNLVNLIKNTQIFEFLCVVVKEFYNQKFKIKNEQD